MANFKAVLLDSLTNGLFHQTTEYLYMDGKYDVLGVACFMSGVPTHILDGVCGLPGDYIYDEIKYNLVLPQSLKSAKQNGLADKLALMNDNGSSFSEIAEWIEANTDENLNLKVESESIALKIAA